VIRTTDTTYGARNGAPAPLGGHVADDEAWADPEIFAGDDPLPLIEPSRYVGRCFGSVERPMFDHRPRLRLDFEIVNYPGVEVANPQHAGTVLHFYCLIDRQAVGSGKSKSRSKSSRRPRKDRDLTGHGRARRKNVGNQSAYWQAWTAANDGVEPKRNDRMSTRVFKDRLFLIEVVTVETDWRGQKRRRPYSTVAAIVERLA
jgi:hypothetical protein